MRKEWSQWEAKHIDRDNKAGVGRVKNLLLLDYHPE